MSYSLKSFTTFALPHTAADLLTVSTADELADVSRQAGDAGRSVLVLGGGSNVLFVEDFAGTVVLNRLAGVRYAQTADDWLIHVAAGENWHNLLVSMLERGVPGLENLALIPGCVGAAPIQNIGAYGVEFAQFCDYVDCLALSGGQPVRLRASDCRFGYRESVFKQAAGRHYVIVAVGLRLAKRWQPVLSYGELARLDGQTITPRQVFDAVCQIRRSRLPDPAVCGNAGSFFKNPLLDARQATDFLCHYPNAPHYPQPDGTVKLAAGWLIDQCQLKGYRIGDAAVHDKQALVIVNLGAANSQQVLQVARLVRQRVAERFGVWLEPEVRFIGAQGEVDALEWLA